MKTIQRRKFIQSATALLALPMRNPPGVIIWRKGACSTTSRTPSSSATPDVRANPRSRTAPTHRSSVCVVSATSNNWRITGHRQFASWKMIPRVCRCPARISLTPWRMLTR